MRVSKRMYFVEVTVADRRQAAEVNRDRAAVLVGHFLSMDQPYPLAHAAVLVGEVRLLDPELNQRLDCRTAVGGRRGAWRVDDHQVYQIGTVRKLERSQ